MGFRCREKDGRGQKTEKSKSYLLLVIGYWFHVTENHRQTKDDR
ncbi:hypothetical protein D1AOALGA4SA_8362 [Olavius algarvensis Delta 1 endosymbiont]|nr:hypothetical protein D1AOALGA4SA_8362 [Olavius algarvensis Delta 1 endosymbiont]